jgi:predicted 3-demethylubiquinone-9 3-methyltransferase (glyoxalase superfamily)
MAIHTTQISPCLWFDSQAEEAANFYVSIFKDGRIGAVSRYGNEGQEIHGRKPGSVMTVEFWLDGLKFTALNGGPLFTFTEAISLQIHCPTQADVDHFWAQLTAGGDPKAQQCGWLKDRFGVSWQVIPAGMAALLGSPDVVKAQRAMKAMLQMKKLDLAALQRAFDGV